MKKQGWDEVKTGEFLQTIAENITDWGQVDPYILKNVGFQMVKFKTKEA